ncbi:membrane protein [Lacrimispora amygdalina]|uniref:Membrane protein n=2 Tax=Lacrimispora amygdalina TaxID=253257 RepID=A0ABQ5M3C6_9FIRM
MINKMKNIDISYKDFIPALSGLIGKIALVTSFALVWAQELSITNPDFVLENVRIEILIGSIITLIASFLYPNAAPAGTLAPLVVLIPVMSAFGVHPLILGITVGVLGILAVRSGLFKYLLDLSGFTCKTSITLTFGISGVWMSIQKLYAFFDEKKHVFWILTVVLIIVYLILFYFKKNWLVIPVISIFAFIIPELVGTGYMIIPVNLNLNLNPFYWWNDMWGIGFGLNGVTILKTIPFALFIILLWAIDTLSIQAIREGSYGNKEKEEQLDIVQSFTSVAVRNMIGAFFGGAQTGSLWRSFLIPLYMIKRPMRICAVILSVFGIIASLTMIPIQIMSYTPLVWSVLLFGIIMPFTVIALTNIKNTKGLRIKLFILLFSALGIAVSPIITWIASVIYEKLETN